MASLNLVSNMVYNGRGQLTLIDRLGANDTTYSYYNATGTVGTGNSNYRLQTIQHGGANTDALPDYQYNYDVVGNITSVLEKTSNATQTSSYGYDHLYRLTSASANSATGLAPAYSHSYEYNELGNLTKLTDGGVAQNFTYPSTADQPHALQTVKVGTTTLSAFVYDETGNMESRNQNGTVYTQAFDHENRLSSVTKSGVTTSFRYDASGQRTTTVEGSVMTYYPFPMYEEEVNGSTVTKRSTYLLGSQAVAVRTQVNSGAATFYYLMGDHLGSASTIVQTNGTVAYQGRFLPFGGERVFPGFSSANNPTELGFTGHHQNMDLGLVYMNARFYVPGIGRFANADTVVPDPGNPQSFNRYSYVYNNPIRFNDPSGHCPLCVLIVAGLSKLVDYGWTAYDASWDTWTLANPEATSGEKFMAALNLSLAAAFEALEPDDMLPIGLPADDLARHALMKGVQEAFEEGGEEAVEALVRESLGEAGEAALKQTDELLSLGDEIVSPNRLPDDALVCRGGTCTPDRFEAGGKLEPDGTLSEVSVTSAPNATVGELVTTGGYQNGKVGVTTVGDIRKQGGDVIHTPSKNNPWHCDICGVASETLSNLFEVIPNIWR